MSTHKKMFAISLVVALVLAAVSAIAASAAPSPTANAAATKVFGHQLRELDFDRAWLAKFMANRNNFVNVKDPNQQRQWIKQYEFALAQADAIVAGRNPTATTNQSNGTSSSSNNNGNSSSNSNSSSSTNSTNLSNLSQSQTRVMQQNLSGWLHEMRELQEKLTGDSPDTNGI